VRLFPPRSIGRQPTTKFLPLLGALLFPPRFSSAIAFLLLSISAQKAGWCSPLPWWFCVVSPPVSQSHQLFPSHKCLWYLSFWAVRLSISGQTLFVSDISFPLRAPYFIVAPPLLILLFFPTPPDIPSFHPPYKPSPTCDAALSLIYSAHMGRSFFFRLSHYFSPYSLYKSRLWRNTLSCTVSRINNILISLLLRFFAFALHACSKDSHGLRLYCHGSVARSFLLLSSCTRLYVFRSTPDVGPFFLKRTSFVTGGESFFPFAFSVDPCAVFCLMPIASRKFFPVFGDCLNFFIARVLLVSS